ncbi:MAG TPA: AAA family ATPase [Desulfuromonadales bacterium]|nr:AAA family ATPase [Desulfuromonadales bacterium]
MKIVALYNIKGGVGKTAACVNLAYSCAACGKRTLIWDLDSQGATSYYFNIDSEIKGGTKKLFKSKEAGELVRNTDIEHLDVIPADSSYRHMDLYLDSNRKPKKQMQDFLEIFQNDYDVVFLDCPPSFSLVSENVFKCADVMLVPLIPTTLSMRTFEQITEYVNAHKKLSLKLFPFFSMVDRRKKLHIDTISTGQQEIDGLLRTAIPYLSVIESMGVHQAPVGKFAPHSQAAELFEQLWIEVSLRLKINAA